MAQIQIGIIFESHFIRIFEYSNIQIFVLITGPGGLVSTCCYPANLRVTASEQQRKGGA